MIGEIFKLGEYRAVEPLLTASKGLIVDVGAHIGVFTLYARALNPKAEILALEPDPQNRLLWQENLALNDLSQIELLSQALACEAGERALIVADEHINHRLRLKSENTSLRIKTIPVEALGLADLPVEIDVIKLDIEGGEFEILEKTASEFLKRPKTWILEYHDSKGKRHQQLEEKFKTLGYGVQTFPSKFEKKMGFILATRK